VSAANSLIPCLLVPPSSSRSSFQFNCFSSLQSTFILALSLSAVYKVLGKEPGESTDSSFDWVRTICYRLVSTTLPSSLSELDNDDLPDDIQGKHVKLPQNSLILPTNQWVDSPQQEPPSDLITLTHLHEAAVVYCLEKRFQQNQIYTATGPILIALNPFQTCQIFIVKPP
jgi:hypothetical protein